MAVRALGPDGDCVYAVAKKGERLVATKNIAGVLFLDSHVKGEKYRVLFLYGFSFSIHVPYRSW